MDDKIAILAADFSGGGVSRMLVNLANGFAHLGRPVVFFVKDKDHAFLEALTETVNLVLLDSETYENLLSSLVHQLVKHRPAVMLSGMLADHELALMARRESKVDVRLFFRSGTNYLEEVKTTSFFSRRKKKKQISRLYRAADAVICVSQGVAEGLSSLCDIPHASIHVLKNPTVTPQLLDKSYMNIDHPWFEEGELPVILGVGSLSRRKNFELLIKAFADLRKDIPSRLVIIGEGKRRERLEQLAAALRVEKYVQLLGFLENPYPYMRAASLFVLSSNREGSPNVLVEAMATGTPVVSTDCPSGPPEILNGGEYGQIVPMGDANSLSRAITRTLSTPVDKDLLKKAVVPYMQEESCKAYLRAFALPKSQ